MGTTGDELAFLTLTGRNVVRFDFCGLSQEQLATVTARTE
jgi:hypothetical protein